MAFLFVAVLMTLLYIAQLLRKLVWLLALVTQNQMITAKLAAHEPSHRGAPPGIWPYQVVGFFDAVRFPWLFRKVETLDPSGNP